MITLPYTFTEQAIDNINKLVEVSLEKAHADDAAYDLRASEPAYVARGGGRAIVPTGVRLAIPKGYAGLVLPRSGIALKHGVTVLNSPGLIDPGYRGEVSVVLVNTTPAVEWDNVQGLWVPTGSGYYVTRGDRIAQLLIVRTEDAEWAYTTDLNRTERGEGGFGSTGR